MPSPYPVPTQAAVDRALTFWNRLRAAVVPAKEVVVVDGNRWVEGTGLDHWTRDLGSSRIGLCRLRKITAGDGVRVDEAEPLATRGCPCGQAVWGTNNPAVIAALRAAQVDPHGLRVNGRQVT